MMSANENPTGGALTVAAIAALRARHKAIVNETEASLQGDFTPMAEDVADEFLRIDAYLHDMATSIVDTLLALVTEQAERIAELEAECDAARDAGRDLLFAAHMAYRRMGQPGRFRTFLTGSYLGQGIDPGIAVQVWDAAYEKAERVFGNIIDDAP